MPDTIRITKAALAQATRYRRDFMEEKFDQANGNASVLDVDLVGTDIPLDTGDGPPAYVRLGEGPGSETKITARVARRAKQKEGDA